MLNFFFFGVKEMLKFQTSPEMSKHFFLRLYSLLKKEALLCSPDLNSVRSHDSEVSATSTSA